MTEQELKKISQEELDEILEQHKLWVKSNGQNGIRADLSFHDLRELEFPTSTNLMRANLMGANLEGIHLAGASFIDANLIGTDFKEAYLMDSNLEGANLEGANLEGAHLEGAHLKKAYLKKANLEGANLAGANLEEANLEEAYLKGIKLERAYLKNVNFKRDDLEATYLKNINFKRALVMPSHNIRFTTNTNLEEQTIQQQFKINQLEQKLQQAKAENNQLEQELQHAQAENNQSQEQRDKIAELEKQSELAKQHEQELQKQLELAKQQEQELQKLKEEKEKLEKEIKSILETNIDEAHKALTNALTNTGKQITNNQRFSRSLSWLAVILICSDIAFVLAIPFLIMAGTLNELLDKTGIWAILFFTFPALLILLIALSLLRHQKQLIAEIRHYSMLKHKIELYGGILKAAQFTASSIMQSQNSEAAKYIQETFNEIKAELLKSPNFDLNAQPHIFPEEGGNLLEMFKSITELLKISTEANKAIAESAKKATTSEK